MAIGDVGACIAICNVVVNVDNGWKNAGERSAFSQNMFRAPSSLFLRRIHVGISIKYSAKNESLLGDEHSHHKQTANSKPLNPT